MAARLYEISVGTGESVYFEASFPVWSNYEANSLKIMFYSLYEHYFDVTVVVMARVQNSTPKHIRDEKITPDDIVVKTTAC